jgi:hypothetical protein
MKKKDDGQRRAATAKATNGGLTARAVLAMWELIITGDGKIASQRSVRLEQPDVRSLVKAGLVTIENGPQATRPTWMSKLHVTDKGWAWANQQGLAVQVPSVQATALVFQALLAKIGAYLQINQLGLHQVLAPRPPESPVEPTSPEPAAAAPTTLEARIRAAYLLATGGVMNQHIKLAHLRAALDGEPAEAVNEELRRMQQRGSTLLYPIDDPQRLRPEDEAAAMRVAGERRDLVCIRG